MRRTIKAGLATLAIALLAACGGTDDPAGNASNGAGSGNQERVERQENNTPAAAIPEPTRPQRLDNLLTPTAEPEANQIPETGKENAGTDRDQNESTGENKVSEDPGDLIPEDPQFNDQILLQDIYARMDLDQFGLDPNEPIENNTSTYMDPEMLRNHPYLHLIPDLDNYMMTRTGITKDVSYSPWRSYPSPPEERRLDFGSVYRPYPDISAARGPITYFIYHPWFEPVFMNDWKGRESLGGTAGSKAGYRYEAGPYWFGENSLRGVLADTVEKLMEEAMVPDAEPHPRLWWREAQPDGNGSLVYNGITNTWFEERDWRLGEFIRTTDSAPFEGSAGRGIYPEESREKFNWHKTPGIDWEIIHPELPILRVTAHAKHELPLKRGGLDPGEKVQRVRGDGIESLVKTIYSVSFVVAFQNRWSSFHEPNRTIIRFREELEPHEWQPHALDPELPYPNYWDDTDYMHHSIIGPVVMTVHDSFVLQHGTYSRVPRITQWEAPGHVLTTSR